MLYTVSFINNMTGTTKAKIEANSLSHVKRIAASQVKKSGHTDRKQNFAVIIEDCEGFGLTTRMFPASGIKTVWQDWA